MYVRGLRTMNTNARSPLIIVDNVERDLSFLDAFPIESVTVLKDAAASALYGMRGANGVILVTTKRGEAGKPISTSPRRWDSRPSATRWRCRIPTTWP